MRIIVWNCNNGISHQSQIDYFNDLKADVAIIPELKEKNIVALKAEECIWVTNNHLNPSPKGLGVLSFNGFKLKQLDRDEDMEIYVPVRVSRDHFSFNLLAVWNFYSACKQGRFKGVKGAGSLEYMALEHYKSMFDDHSLIAGDFNFGPTFSAINFLKMVSMLERSNLFCLYHKHHKLQKDVAGPMTFKHGNGKSLHWLDHVFGSKIFSDSINSFEVGDLDKVVLSDHAPLILEFSLPAV